MLNAWIRKREANRFPSRFAHKHGLYAILLQSTHATEVVRAMAYDELIGAYLISCARGEPSKFDGKFWLNLDPTSGQAPTKVLASLRKVAYRLSIRLPGLMVLVRGLRSRAFDSRTASRAVSLAEELLAEKDEQAENKLLHSVKVTKLWHLTHVYIVPASLKFSSFAEFEAGMYYWQTRIVLNRLGAKLQRTLPDRQRFDLDAIDKENRRMAANLLMAWESAFESSAFGIVRGGAGTTTFAYAMMAVWGVLLDVKTFMGHESGTVRKWLLEGLQILTHRGIRRISAEQMDESADLFAGGPVQGLLPSIVGRSPG